MSDDDPSSEEWILIGVAIIWFALMWVQQYGRWGFPF